MGTRNIFTVVPVPKSKIRRQVPVVSSLTQVAIVKLLRPLTMPLGRVTWSLLPSRLTALPACPATQVGPFTSVPLRLFPDESIAVVPLVELNWYQAIWPLEGGGVAVGVGLGPTVGVLVRVGVGPTLPSPDGTVISVVSAWGCPRLGVLSAFQLSFWMRVVRSVRPHSPFGLFTP